MPTRMLMTASAIAMCVLGLLLTFAPQEVLTSLGSAPQTASVLAAQAAGALYLGFAMLNWMARHSLIGGIYSRPVAMGNLLHFVVMTFALLHAIRPGLHNGLLIACAIAYATLTILFGFVFFGRQKLSGELAAK